MRFIVCRINPLHNALDAKFGPLLCKHDLLFMLEILVVFIK